MLKNTNNEPSAQNDETKKYIFDIPDDFEPDELGLGIKIFNSMKKYSNAVAQYVTDTGESESYNQLLERCVRVAIHLQSRNLIKNDIIVLCSYNQKHSIVPFVASLFLTIPVASLDPSMSLMDVSHLLKEVTPKILFVIPEVLHVIEESLEQLGIHAEIVIMGESDRYTEFSSFLEPVSNEDTFVPISVESVEETAVILFSSGTTGLPKGIMLSHYALQFQANLLVISGNIGPVNLTYSTLYWISCVFLSLANFDIGAAKVLCEKFDPNKIWYLIDKYKIYSSILAPSQGIAMIKAGRPDDIDTTSLWSCIIAGAPLPEKQLLELRDVLPGTFVFQAYGQSEVAGIITWFKTNKVEERLYLHAKPKSVGLLAPGTFKVVDLETEEKCGPNQQGELRIKSRNVMNGYYKRDSSETFDNEGWLRTGDVVYYDEDQCFYIVDRIKEMLKFRSFHVPPAMLEQVIMTHPAVSHAVVIGIPHDEDGDHPMALVIPKILDKDNIAEEIMKYVEERVPDRMRLRGGIKIISSFPLTPSGKTKRRDLREMVLNGKL